MARELAAGRVQRRESSGTGVSGREMAGSPSALDECDPGGNDEQDDDRRPDREAMRAARARRRLRARWRSTAVGGAGWPTHGGVRWAASVTGAGKLRARVAGALTSSVVVPDSAV